MREMKVKDGVYPSKSYSAGGIYVIYAAATLRQKETKIEHSSRVRDVIHGASLFCGKCYLDETIPLSKKYQC